MEYYLEEAQKHLPTKLEEAQKQIASGGKWAWGALSGTLGVLGKFGFQLAMMLIAFFFLLRDGGRLVDWLAESSPLGQRTRELLSELRAVARSVLGANFITGAVQAVVATIGFYIGRAPSPIFFGLLTLFSSLIPSVGSALVTLPVAVLVLLLGHKWAALFLAIWALVVVGLIDNLLRPWLIRGGAQLHGALVFFSLIGAIGAVGAVGLFLGPLILTFFLAAVRIDRRARGGCRSVEVRGRLSTTCRARGQLPPPVAFVAQLALLAPGRARFALARQHHAHVDAAHDGDAVHAHHRRVRIGGRGRAVDLREAAHDRRAVHLHRQSGRHDDVDAPEHGAHVDVDAAGREARLAQIQLHAAHRRRHAQVARHRPRPATLHAAEHGEQRLAVLVGGHQRRHHRRTGGDDVFRFLAVLPVLVRAGRSSQQRVDRLGRILRVRQRHTPFELFDLQRVGGEVLRQARDRLLARLTRALQRFAIDTAEHRLGGRVVVCRHDRASGSWGRRRRCRLQPSARRQCCARPRPGSSGGRSGQRVRQRREGGGRVDGEPRRRADVAAGDHDLRRDVARSRELAGAEARELAARIRHPQPAGLVERDALGERQDVQARSGCWA